MSSNNADFQISEVFNVKGKIALVTVRPLDPDIPVKPLTSAPGRWLWHRLDGSTGPRRQRCQGIHRGPNRREAPNRGRNTRKRHRWPDRPYCRQHRRQARHQAASPGAVVQGETPRHLDQQRRHQRSHSIARRQDPGGIWQEPFRP